jgi:hypothetical protein
MTNVLMNLFVVEYSLSQGAFHISTIKEMLQNNVGMILHRQTSNDYLVVGITETHEEAVKLSKVFEQYVENGEWPSVISDE